MADKRWEEMVIDHFAKMDSLDQLYLIQRLISQMTEKMFLDRHRDPETGELPEHMRHLEPYESEPTVSQPH